MRVAITGIGCVSAMGANAAEYRHSLTHGLGGITDLPPSIRGSLSFSKGAYVKDLSVSSVPRSILPIADRFAVFGLTAALEALSDSGIQSANEDYQEGLVLTASCVGGQDSQEEGFQRLYQRGKINVSPFTVPRVMANSAASLISLVAGIRGPSLTISTACSSSTHAIGLAAWMIHHGLVKWAIAGGSEAPFSFGHLKAWESLRVVSNDYCRPFDINRRGLILGEGGAMIVMERSEDARARGARIYAEVVGFGMSSDSHHITQPNPSGVAVAINHALDDADIQPADIGYVNAHGTGTQTNDLVESKALEIALGSHARKVLLSSTKSAHGHALGATGALEAIASIFALQDQFIPPTLNVLQQDPDCPVNLITDKFAPSSHLEYALSNSLAFGGTNACLIFKQPSN